jgi:hypothetical protein
MSAFELTRKTFAQTEFFRLCEGLRMPAHEGGAGGGVCEPSETEKIENTDREPPTILPLRSDMLT